jgi:hypothetical protein
VPHPYSIHVSCMLPYRNNIKAYGFALCMHTAKCVYV